MQPVVPLQWNKGRGGLFVLLRVMIQFEGWLAFSYHTAAVCCATVQSILTAVERVACKIGCVRE